MDIIMKHEKCHYVILFFYKAVILVVYFFRYQVNSSPPSRGEFPPIKLNPNLTLTQNLTLNQVGIHRGEIDQRRIFRTPFFSYLNIAVPYNVFNIL